MNNIKYMKDLLSLVYDRYIKGIRGPIVVSNRRFYRTESSGDIEIGIGIGIGIGIKGFVNREGYKNYNGGFKLEESVKIKIEKIKILNIQLPI
jgi:hypothetical protein